MSKFKKKEGSTPVISTASLPDIVFMLLFFFMVTTVLRDTEAMVDVKLPQASQLQKLEKKSLISDINIGRPMEARYGTEPRIQANDVFIEPKSIPRFIEAERNELPENERDKHMINLRVSKESKMGIVTDVKEQLREVDARSISYHANQGGQTEN